MIPPKGWSMSMIRNIAPETDSADSISAQVVFRIHRAQAHGQPGRAKDAHENQQPYEG